MDEKTETEPVPDDYLKMLEKVKEQYQQYLEVSEVCEFVMYLEEKPVRYLPPTPEHPLNTNGIRIG